MVPYVAYLCEIQHRALENWINTKYTHISSINIYSIDLDTDLFWREFLADKILI